MLRRAIGQVAAGHGIRRVVVVGYANGYTDYFTTPAEYEIQAYEGGSTVYGKNSALVLRDTLVDLARRLVNGQAAPTPYPFDPNNGVHVGSAAYGSGAASGTPNSQPTGTQRLGHATFSWSGGANGIDRPVDRAFVSVQRRVRKRWVPFTSDLGLEIAWLVSTNGQYSASWEPPLSTPTGTYRFKVTAKRYALISRAFAVTPATTLTPRLVGDSIELAYPRAVENQDWDYRPAVADGGHISFVVGGKLIVERRSKGTSFRIPGGASVAIPAHGARDRWGNTNGQTVSVLR
jgi:neutral ceramidase